jgi:hypothetical protein
LRLFDFRLPHWFRRHPASDIRGWRASPPRGNVPHAACEAAPDRVACQLPRHRLARWKVSDRARMRNRAAVSVDAPARRFKVCAQCFKCGSTPTDDEKFYSSKREIRRGEYAACIASASLIVFRIMPSA